ncbi:MAG: helix-turn-helix domain-containing protein [Candidatus Thermoplasmatota archaeon]|nr:helix-turn-helix domain-containing protein [Candidatus Thermoplasmatota archaeon]
MAGPDRSRKIRMSTDEMMEFFFHIKGEDLCIYRDLLKSGPATAKELGGRMGKDRGPVYSGVTSLVRTGLVRKTVKKRKAGGLYYVYDAMEPEKVHDLLCERIKDWQNSIESSLTKVCSDLRKAG